MPSPTASLDTNRYTTQLLKYPRDLGSQAKMHSIVFVAEKIDPITLQEAPGALKSGINSAIDSLKNVDVGQSFSNAAQSTASGISNAAGAVSELTTDKFVNASEELLTKGVSGLAKASKFISSGSRTTIGDAITLYMPETLNFSQAAQYDKLSLADAASSLPIVGTIAKAITSTVGNEGNAAVRLLLNKAGYVFNPQQQVLFEGIDFRTFNFTFTFTPFSAEESVMVKKIIQSFRQNAAPTINTGVAGFFFTPPSIYNITFMYGGRINENINKLKRCVLENVDVNYAPNGWSAHNDGSPTQITMSLNFKEIELVDSVAVGEGY